MMFTQLKHYLFRAGACSVILLAVFAQSAYAASQSSHTSLLKHRSGSGGQGKDVIVLKVPDNVGSKCAKFVSADVIYKKRRFGEVKLLKKPASGCNPARRACKITTSFEYAPAGRLDYRLKINWNVTASGC